MLRNVDYKDCIYNRDEICWIVVALEFLSPSLPLSKS